MTPGHHVGGGDVCRHADGGDDGGVGSHELYVGLVGAGGVGLDDALGDDAGAGDGLGVVAEALGHGAPSSIWWSYLALPPGPRRYRVRRARTRRLALVRPWRGAGGGGPPLASGAPGGRGGGG